MKGPTALGLLLALVLVLVLAVSRFHTGSSVDRCLVLDGRWNEQAVACARQAWPEDRSRGRD
ncbi:hypothetical protein AB595_16645 [Massilia sp. WF1]|uniref:hypothetical protein n=1 Tax=unclassified Massilia TaxID=2609279 RepID=UPI0006497201|nr:MULTISPECIES: hypothetical protein [unclassified Massilia]ALK95397.1 hypothetical protein AM586_02900 [Massilia sp. WG5]KLU35719.1 hypothetical protein AB595_16645 [Massilia sp. WF1]